MKECRLNLHVSPETDAKFRELCQVTGSSLGVVFAELVEIGGSIMLEQRIAKLKAAMAAKSTTPTQIKAVR